MSEIKKPEIIYHYCSVETFMKIIENKSLWLSNARKMNDFNETVWINKFIESKIDILDKNKYPKFREEFEAIYKANDNIPYLACFSEEGDLLSQWRGYADDAGGVAIGFSLLELGISEKLPCTSVENTDTLGLQRCIYDKEKQERFINLIFEIEEEPYDVLSIVDKLKKMSYLYKNHGFSEEKEWRIIHTPLLLDSVVTNGISAVGGISEIKFRPLKNDMTSYFIYNFKERANSSLIKEIILGPKCTINKYDLDMFLSINGFKNTEIKFSEVSYR